VAQLEEPDRQLIWLRFFEQRSQSDIANELGISQMQVSRLLTRLLLKLRSIIGAPEDAVA
jgi:RNA polymerase sigma-B factor